MEKYGELDLLIKNYVELVKEEAQAGFEAFPKISEDYQLGYRMGLAAALKYLKITLEIEDEDKAFGLDFDIEKEVAGIDAEKLVAR